ncbi:T9SS type A sorting domain-containing protein [Flavobacterium sp. N502536]|uniref:T9SS type A sorting domain-containing protein n=1 Tax=Flavobacterium sp. N502536 TaxID=2986837 RepID=UPI002223B2CB|nr:T9SS type A sorting domain-containing protein [Flavobacterium sp. N502536]
MKKLYLLLALLLFAMQHLSAQIVETFENQTNEATSFTSAGKTFDLSSSYRVFKVVQFDNLGNNNSNKFIHVEDAISTESFGQSGTISASKTDFKVNSLWIYVTGVHTFYPGATSDGLSGAITFVGKFKGVTKFTVTKNTTGGNIGDASPHKGFFLVDFDTEGGVDNSIFIIDTLEIKLSNNYDYFSIDDFNFANGIEAPTVITTTAKNTGSLKADMGGDVTADGGDANIERGIVWSTSVVNPTISDTKFPIGTGTGVFSDVVSGFPPLSLIYYRAYAKNSGGINYGAVYSFTTTATFGVSAATSTNVSCAGRANGSSSVSVSGGRTPYSYLWTPLGGNESSATGLMPGNYKVVVTDAEGTQIVQNFVISEPTGLDLGKGIQKNVFCFGDADGEAGVSVTGGTPPYSYSWLPSGGNEATATGLTAGTYTVTVTDSHFCQATKIFNILQPIAGMTASIESKPATACGTESDGWVTVKVANGTPPYTYLWETSGGVTATETGLSPGTYSVIITDLNGCTLKETAVILLSSDTTAPIPNVADLPTITSYCAIQSSEIIIPTATDNCAGNINATTTSLLNYNAVGSYIITWIYNDGNGNSATQNQTVNVVASPLDLVMFNDATYTFDGGFHANQVVGLPDGAKVVYSISPETGSLNSAKNVGIYTITAVVSPTAGTNCSPIMLTAKLIIDKAKALQRITFDSLPVKSLGANNNFTLEAVSDSGLPIRYSFVYTSSQPPANVSASGLVSMLRSGQVVITAHQDGDSDYLPAAAVSQTLLIQNNNADIAKLAIGNLVYNNPSQKNTYFTECEAENSLTVSVVNESNATISPSSSFTIQLSRPGIYNQDIKVVSEDGTVVKIYTLEVLKTFDFFDIVRQKFNSTLLVNNNPQTNGGYEFVAYEWFKNGKSVGTDQYYLAGESVNSTSDTIADYMVKMTTKEGKVLQTCTAKIVLQNSAGARVYPNPAEAGKMVTVEVDYPVEELENMQISLYTVSGQLVKTIKSSTVKTEIQLPSATESNMYLVLIETANTKKTLKVIVNK